MARLTSLRAALNGVSLMAGMAAATIATTGQAQAQTNILFVGNSYTHGRYQPVLSYNGAAASDPSNNVVHDLLCPGTGTTCTSGVEAVSPVVPTSTNTPGTTLANQLSYLSTNSASRYTEVGPYSGVAGIFLQLSQEAGLNYNVSVMAVSSATLTGYLNNSPTGNEAGDLPLITNTKYQNVVLQDQSFQPLPTSITVAGPGVVTHSQATRGNPSSFDSGVNGLISAINTSHGNTNTQITLFETPPIASNGYTSSNPAQPIFGSSTVAAQNGNQKYAPYVGDANPIASMASDLHNAYTTEAANAAGTYGNNVNVALAGDAWVSAINLGYAQQNPFLLNEPVGQLDLWDSNPYVACCTVPVGYHPSAYGDYLDALTLFDTITGENPLLVTTEFNPNAVGYSTSASDMLGIDPQTAHALAQVASATQTNGAPVPEPASMAVLGLGIAGIAAVRRRRAG